MGWLCDGICEEVLTTLGRVPDVRVVARASSFRFRGAELDLVEVGRELGATHVLEGSARNSGGVLRVTVRLARCRVRLQVWSHALERGTGDVFALQDEIAGLAAAALSGAAALPARPSPTADPAAYHHYLHGLYHLARRPGEAMRRAVECFERALELDPDFAAAHAALAEGWALSGAWESAARSPAEAMAGARRHPTRRCAARPSAAGARALACLQLHYDRDAERALATFGRASRASPSRRTRTTGRPTPG
jgi:serine/threonine-protein kinase